jgi:hypothetical protein
MSSIIEVMNEKRQTHNIANVFDQLRHNDPANIRPYVWLVRERAVLGKQQVLGEALPVVREATVKWAVAPRAVNQNKS